MPRAARIVVPGYPHHITQRGNRKQKTFFRDDDYELYIALIKKYLAESGVAIWAYCLMPNHVHLIAVPDAADGLSKLLRVAHHKYARAINKRKGWQGHLWQERYYSFVMDERHLLAAARYVELNPVRAGLCERPDQWRWSSVHAHLDRRSDPIVDPAPLRELVFDWPAYLDARVGGPTLDQLRRHTHTGQPAGDDSFLDMVETATGRSVRKQKPGPKPRN